MISPFSILPFLPVPVTSFKSTLCYLAHIFTVGDVKISSTSTEGCWIGCIYGNSTFSSFRDVFSAVFADCV